VLKRAQAQLIRFCEPMKQSFQLPFICPLPLEATAQPPHGRRDPRPRGYLSAAIVQRHRHEGLFC
jgi:hypothetical protein